MASTPRARLLSNKADGAFARRFDPPGPRFPRPTPMPAAYDHQPDLIRTYQRPHTAARGADRRGHELASLAVLPFA